MGNIIKKEQKQEGNKRDLHQIPACQNMRGRICLPKQEGNKRDLHQILACQNMRGRICPL